MSKRSLEIEKQKILKGAEPFYFERGKIGCLLCHGYTGTPKEMLDIGKYLADKGITVYGPLLPGHGTKVEDLIIKSAKDWYSEYRRAYEKLRKVCDEIFICGLSLGGVLTLKFATEEKVAGVIVLATPILFRFPENILLTLLAPLLSKFALKKSKKELEEQKNLDILCYDKYPIGPANSLRKLIKKTRRNLDKITNPILIVQGLKDERWIVRSSKIILNEVSSESKKIITLEKSPHCLTVGPEKTTVSELIIDFIKENSQNKI
ncbi:MAG: alpha/beta hydrolase [Candidatus Thorarchaeota archaeon]